MKRLILILIISNVFQCSSPTDFTDLQEFVTEAPVASGVIWTDTNGYTLGIIGTPADGHRKLNFKNTYPEADSNQDSIIQIIPSSISVHSPFPNPTNGPVSIYFNLPRNLFVKVWVVRANFSNSNSNHPLLVGAVFDNTTEYSKVILPAAIRKASRYNLNWNPQDKSGSFLPDGFYRIYVQIDNHLFWRDVLLNHLLEDIGFLYP